MKDIFERNEAGANKSVAQVMRITIIIFTVILILDLLEIFIIKKSVMITTYCISTVLLLIPTVFNKIFGLNKHWLKYVYILIASIFVLLLATTLTYHIVLIYSYPIAIACLYFDSKTVRISIFLTIVVTVLGQILGYHFSFNVDKNFYTVKRLILFSILPRLFTLSCFASLFMLLTRRTTRLLKVQENDVRRIGNFDNEMITGFASLVESRDADTGGHIMRTREYVKLIAEELYARNLYPEIVNESYIENVIKAAPLHDIGKIAIKDSILQKAGKLTPEEYEEMKTHSSAGGRIIQENFSHVGDRNFRRILYKVVLFHHEKWNGKGYPKGLKENDIPICARIMAVADVFDAVSQHRCYRDAMPIEQCFEIIKNGSGQDFDPVIAETFLDIKDKVIKVKNTQFDGE